MAIPFRSREALSSTPLVGTCKGHNALGQEAPHPHGIEGFEPAHQHLGLGEEGSLRPRRLSRGRLHYKRRPLKMVKHWIAAEMKRCQGVAFGILDPLLYNKGVRTTTNIHINNQNLATTANMWSSGHLPSVWVVCSTCPTTKFCPIVIEPALWSRLPVLAIYPLSCSPLTDLIKSQLPCPPHVLLPAPTFGPVWRRPSVAQITGTVPTPSAPLPSSKPLELPILIHPVATYFTTGATRMPSRCRFCSPILIVDAGWRWRGNCTTRPDLGNRYRKQSSSSMESSSASQEACPSSIPRSVSWFRCDLICDQSGNPGIVANWDFNQCFPRWFF